MTQDSSLTWKCWKALGVLETRSRILARQQDIRRIAIAKILEHVGAEDATEVVVVAKDGKKVVIAGEDVAEYEIMLATKDGGKAIGSGLGGPVKLVFPYDDYEGLEEKYPKDDWSWYVVTLEVNAK